MAGRSDTRPDPDLLLRQVMAQERHAVRERLKIFLGYASGVGKTMRMLDEARRRQERGQNVLIGAVQPQARPRGRRPARAIRGHPAEAGPGRRSPRR